ncbi:hypothetical protein [Paenibacillus sp. MER TA 81-3]|nr:hypothetical protein [Paenibacillus sp. MER TA 81-3]
MVEPNPRAWIWLWKYRDMLIGNNPILASAEIDVLYLHQRHM